MVESSGTLIVKNVRPGDDAVYSCRAKNLLGSVNATAKLTVQCKLLGVFSSGYVTQPFQFHSDYASTKYNHSGN